MFIDSLFVDICIASVSSSIVTSSFLASLCENTFFNIGKIFINYLLIAINGINIHKKDFIIFCGFTYFIIKKEIHSANI